MPRYTDEKSAVELYFCTYMTIQQIVDKLNYPTRQCLRRWLKKTWALNRSKFQAKLLSQDLKMKAISKVMSGDDAKEVASELGINSHASIYNWINIYSSEGE